jgi:hypothetical protein
MDVDVVREAEQCLHVDDHPIRTLGDGEQLVHECVVAEAVDDHEAGVGHQRRVLRAALEGVGDPRSGR